MSTTNEQSSGFWGFIDNLKAQIVFATVITVIWLIWIFIEISSGGT